ncbi:MAG: S-layer homology domain-containing protein [Clostridia bacterium]|nr:S-layer homology domain-containing protein [Clostridia bacterium]
MRNFKKFLALVLAMLMVSACAVSVSAAYADQAAIDATGYAEAVEVLSALQVIAGDGTNFMPNDTLTRAAAAKIAAMLSTGAAGQKIEWKSSTSSFTDVDPAHWGNAYINYASQHGIMDGIGGGKFAPDATLSVAEAIVIAVKAAGLRADVAKLDEIAKPAFWATNWIAVANGDNAKGIDLTANVTVFDYTASCTRAMFAQIAYNMLNKVEKIADGFGLEKASAKVVSVADGKVTLSDGSVIGLEAFNAAMAAAGIEGTAEALKGAIVTVTYSADANVIYGVALDSNAAAYTYADGKIANVKDKDGNLTEKVTIDGVSYVVNGEDEDDKNVIGSTVSTKGIVITVDGTIIPAKTALPTYYSAVAYDDDSDGDFDRLVVDEYAIATVDYATADKNSDGVTFDTIKYIDGSAWTNKIADNEKAINYTGEAVPDEETPVLVNVKWNADTSKWDVDVLEVAKTVSGKLTAVAAKYVKIDGTNYEFVANKQAIENWALNQNVSVYTIGGKYVKFASASYSDIEVVVNSAVVTDGKAVITGYNKSANFADITITIDGINDGKLVARTAKQYTAKDADDKEYNTTVAVGYYDGDTFKENFNLVEGAIVSIRDTADGNYINSIKGLISENGTAGSAAKFEVKGGYVYIGDVASMYFADGAVILAEVVDADAKANAYNKVTYNKMSDFAVRASVDYRYEAKDNKVSFLYVEAGHTATTTITKSKTLADGQSIVYIADDAIVEATFDNFVYNAIDLMSGEKVTITHTGAVTKGNYYIVKDGAVVENTTGKWIGNYDVEVVYANGGLIGVVKAQPVVASYDSATKVTTYAQEGDVLDYGLDKITIYNAGVLDGDGNVSKADVNKTLMTGTTHDVTGDIYVVAGQMIIVLK